MSMGISDAEIGTDIDGVGANTSPRCFLHIPKGAGSSIHSALSAKLPPGSFAPRHFDSSLFCDFNDFELLSPEARCYVAANRSEVQSLGGYRAVSGHFSLATLLQITDASSISTVLREPRARLLSLYMYWRTPKIGDFWAPYSVTEHAQRPFSAFLSEPRLAPVVDNQICRMLLHGDPRLPQSGFAAQSDIQAIAVDATAMLDKLGFVGVIELGDSAWRGVARLFDVTLDPIKANVTGELESLAAIRPGETLFTTEAFDLLEQRNAADMLVYDHMLTLAGLATHERQQLRDGAFARQLVKLGDLLGHSAARAAEQAGAVEVLRSELKERERSHAQLDEVRDRLRAHERTVQDLNDEIRRRDEDLDKLRHWLAAVHASASWRMTAPFRAAKHGMQRLRRPGRSRRSL
jgi:cell division protein FtsB